MIEWVIVQAGGKGTRLEHLTANKPKALVPVSNLPMLFHLFRKFPDKKYVVIADTHRDVLRKYLKCFAEVDYRIVDAAGAGTCGGVAEAAELVPAGEPVMLIWSDLILPDTFKLPDGAENTVGISKTFPCRWSFRDGQFIEEPSSEFGVAGLFTLQSRDLLKDVPESGELVRWLSHQDIEFQPLDLSGTREFGVLAEYNKLGTEKSRPFNKITISNNKVIKEALDSQGESLAAREVAWYQFANSHGVVDIPKVFAYNPLTMEKVTGKHPYELGGLSKAERLQILEEIVQGLQQLHSVASAPVDQSSVITAYLTKTMDRLRSVENLIPFADQRTVVVNGRTCCNVLFDPKPLENAIHNLNVPQFTFIHGDSTFSNTIYESQSKLKLRALSEVGISQSPALTHGHPVFIDPRGYFGETELLGDPNYDWAKLYYSLKGNYDQFNLQRFRLGISDGDVSIEVQSSGWEDTEEQFFQLTGADRNAVRLLHGIIWLSLTTYAWHDYDSICGAFYNGLFYLEDVL